MPRFGDGIDLIVSIIRMERSICLSIEVMVSLFVTRLVDIFHLHTLAQYSCSQALRLLLEVDLFPPALRTVWPIFVWRFRLLGINTSHLDWGTFNRRRLGVCRSLIRTRLPLGSRISHYWIKAIATPKTSECIPASFKQMNHAQWIQLFFFRQCVSNQRL